MAELLTDDELQALTGTASRAIQRRVLRENGIRFVKGIGDKISVTWTAVNYTLTGQHKQLDDSTINWGAINGKAS